MVTRSKTTLIVVHVTATPPGWDKGVAGIRAIHKAQGWSDIGYNGIINPDGTYAVGRGEDAVGAHVAGFNSISFGISLVGGIDKNGKPDVNTITKAQWATLEKELKRLVKKYPNAKICGHRDLSPDKNGNGIIEPFEHIKACPTFDAIPWAESKGLPGANIKGVWKVSTPIEAPSVPLPEVVVGPDTRNAYLQRLLVKAGYSIGPIDGIVGKKTKAAIRVFEMANGLKSTGTFSPKVVKLLRERFEGALA